MIHIPQLPEVAVGSGDPDVKKQPPPTAGNSASIANQLVEYLDRPEERERVVEAGFRHLQSILQRWPKASDIHVRCEKTVRVQVGSQILSYEDLSPLCPATAAGFVLALHRCRSGARDFAGTRTLASEENRFLRELGWNQKAEFSAKGDSFLIPEMPTGRLRVHCFWDQNGIACTARILQDTTPAWDTLGFQDDTSAQLRKLVLRKGGIAFVTGQTGNGKSTTLAALAQWILNNHSRHIVTIEDPIEYVLDDRRASTDAIPSCLVTQQEVGGDIGSFHDGVVDVLRKHPDIVILGECRTRETMEAALTCADTGHLVLATLHTRDAVSTLSRIIKLFPEIEREGILQQLSESLCFVLSQGLLPAADEPSRKVLCYEFLVNDEPASRSAIMAYSRDPTSLRGWMNNSKNVAWNRCLEHLRAAGRISSPTYESNVIRHATTAL